MVGCTGGGRGGGVNDETSQSAQGRVVADGYLFDAKLRQDGKPTSVRLELLRTDSVMSIAGRAYLGKGALRGRLTSETLQVYLPTSNEYVEESVTDIVNSSSCAKGSLSINLLSLFSRLPDSMRLDSAFEMTVDSSRQSRRLYSVTRRGCDWRFQIAYDRPNGDWLVDELTFSNGEKFTLRARRREVRSRVSVPIDRFEVTIPRDAQRIRPRRD